MAAFPATLVLFLFINTITGYILTDDNEPNVMVILPTDYHFNGETINFITKHVETFELWHSGSLNRSRIDFYGGTEKQYYYEEDQYLLTIHPFTEDEELNMGEMCAIGTSESNTIVDDKLPDVSEMVYSGIETVLGREVNVWKSEEIKEKMIKIEVILYVYKSDNEDDIPVQTITKKNDMKTGAITSVITNFYNFHDTVTEEDVSYAKEEDCHYMGEDFKQDIKLLRPHVPWELDAAFRSYLAHHKKSYTADEHETRKSIFEDNWRMINEVNAKNLGYKLELNAFSDQTKEELKYLTGLLPRDPSQVKAAPFPHTDEEVAALVEDLPKTFDLRVQGFVTPIKHQGHCGSCWAFCTTAALESAYARKHGGELLDLSEQSLVDCAWGYDNMGCGGGLLDEALRYIEAHGIPTEESYGSYEEKDAYCHVGNMSEVYTMEGFGRVTPHSSNALKVALEKYGPVPVAIYVTEKFTHYSSGIFYDFDVPEGRFNHGVTVVGYGERDGDEYWIVKNSWGEGWGEDGFILVSMKNNNCNILDNAFYLIL